MAIKAASKSGIVRLLAGTATVAAVLVAPNATANASEGGGCGETVDGITVCIADNGDNRVHAWTLIWPERHDDAVTRIEICRVADPECADRAAGPVAGTDRGAEIFAVPGPGTDQYFAAYHHGDVRVTSVPLTWR
ncbi:hypothetical protein BJY24_006281 [Nocardia transvalensis]|uniref:Secreted protein n=1 Tax=Nocardia transvalensis TaxID=37333 RepID=A0A7W9PKN2_9NOCA|nr:hypothetical protein [Nocardia transvalensis]MBB5917369.1 hypothetical protein [Nocardia transvalensis]